MSLNEAKKGKATNAEICIQNEFEQKPTRSAHIISRSPDNVKALRNRQQHSQAASPC